MGNKPDLESYNGFPILKIRGLDPNHYFSQSDKTPYIIRLLLENGQMSAIKPNGTRAFVTSKEISLTFLNLYNKDRSSNKKERKATRKLSS